jgi:transcription factor AP-1
MTNSQPRNFTLDLNSATARCSRRVRGSLHGLTMATCAVLTTPDVQMLKLSSPELAKFLNAGVNVSTPTPFPKTVSEEQALYAQGFEDALNNVRKTSTSSNIPSSVSQVPDEAIKIKEEEMEDEDEDATRHSFSSASSSASGIPHSPINMEVQETAKLERKRLRNRQAATKCRRRKLERIANLDDRVNVLKEENTDLAVVVKRLRSSVCDLKQEVMEHVHNGCQIMVSEGVAF